MASRSARTDFEVREEAFAADGLSRTLAVGGSKHRVVVRRLVRNGLYDVPVLDNLAVLDSEDVHHGSTAILRGVFEIAVRYHQVVLGDHPFNVDVSLGELPAHPLDEPDERFGSVGGLRIVLNVPVA